MKRTLSLAASLMLAVMGARASDVITFTLTQPFASTYPGGLVWFDATVSAPDINSGPVYLNADAFNVEFPLSLDDSPFNSFPLFLNPGDSYEDALFSVFVPLGTAEGIYTGYFEIQGGGDPSAGNPLASVNFDVQVTPEPASFVMLAAGALVVLGRLRKRVRR